MLTSATYARNGRRATISLERIDTFLEYTDTIVNFPGIVVLDGDRLVLSANHARHGDWDGEPLRTFLSEDGGASWTLLGLDSPFLDAHPLTGENYLTFAGGNRGYMRDGTITHIDVHQADLEKRAWSRREGPMHAIMQTPDPTFRWRRWSGSGEPLENRLITLENTPWETGSYENYARILELGDGELLTAMGVLAGAPPRCPAWTAAAAPTTTCAFRRASSALTTTAKPGRSRRPSIPGSTSRSTARTTDPSTKDSTKPTWRLRPTATWC